MRTATLTIAESAACSRTFATPNAPALLRLLQLVSPSFPVGAFAYSQGLEGALDKGWVSDEATALAWTVGLMERGVGTLEVPILARAVSASAVGDELRLAELSAFQLACREARELQDEDLQLGRALLRALENLGVPVARSAEHDVTYAVAFGLAAHHFEIDRRLAAMGFVYAWCDNQVLAASRSIPLGQNSAQRVLARCVQQIQRVVERGLLLTDDELGLTAPGLGIASAHHETQYTRPFRS
jgi:urease accessory protein